MFFTSFYPCFQWCINLHVKYICNVPLLGVGDVDDMVSKPIRLLPYWSSQSNGKAGHGHFTLVLMTLILMVWYRPLSCGCLVDSQYNTGQVREIITVNSTQLTSDSWSLSTFVCPFPLLTHSIPRGPCPCCFSKFPHSHVLTIMFLCKLAIFHLEFIFGA